MEMDKSCEQLWIDIKRKLDEEMSPEDLKKRCERMEAESSIKAMFLMKKRVPLPLSCELPSDLVTFLENNMTEHETISIIKHVLGTMEYHTEIESHSFVDMIGEYEHRLKQAGIFREENFVGRKKDIKRVVDDLITSKYQGIWIYGMGGIGKTTFAEEVCARLYHLQSRLDVINVDLKQATNACDVLRGILRHYHNSSSNSDFTILLQEVMHHVGICQHDICIVLDNMEDVYVNNKQEMETFINRLLTFTQDKQINLKFILTSRIGGESSELPRQDDVVLRFDDRVVEFQMLPLKHKHARMLLKRFCKPITLAKDKCDVILEKCGNSPLAIRLVSGTIRELSADQLESEYAIRGLLDTVLKTGMSDCIRYAYEMMDNDMQTYLHMLSVFETSTFADVADIAYILAIPEQEALIVLMFLSHRQFLQLASVRQHVVEINPAETSRSATGFTYCFHPLICNFLNQIERKDLQQKEMNASGIRFCKRILKKFDKFPDYEINEEHILQFIQKNVNVIITLFNVLITEGYTINISIRQTHFLSRIASLVMSSTKRREYYSKLADNFQARLLIESYFYWKTEVAICYVEDDNDTDAKDEISSIEDGVKSLDSESSVIIKANFFLTKGRFLRRKREFSEAMNCLEQSLELFRSCQPTVKYLSRIAYVFNAIGNVHYDKSYLDDALTCHQEAVNIMKDIAKDTVNLEMSIYTFNLGTIFYAKGNNASELGDSDAKELFEKACVIFDESITCDVKFGQTRLSKYADKLVIRSQLLVRLKRFEEAAADAKQALEVRRNEHETYNSKRTLAYYHVGRVYLSWLQREKAKMSINRELKNILVNECIEYFRGAQRETITGGLNNTDKGSREFIADYRKLAKHVIQSKFQNEVKQFCMEFEAGFPSSSSSSSSSHSASDESEMDDITSCHDNDEVFMSSVEVTVGSVGDDKEITKRKRPSTASESD